MSAMSLMKEKGTEGSEKSDTSADLFFGGLFEAGQDPRLFGEDVDPDVPLPPEYEKDFWEDPKFNVTFSPTFYILKTKS